MSIRNASLAPSVRSMRASRGCAALLLLLAVLVSSRAAHAAAPAGRYSVDVANDTVTDTTTGLIWQRTLTGATYATAPDAKAACSARGAGFRLPTYKELLTLVDPTIPSPSIDPTAFPATPSDAFWSMTPVAGSTTAWWYVNFYTGYGSTSEGDSAPNNYARCVR